MSVSIYIFLSLTILFFLLVAYKGVNKLIFLTRDKPDNFKINISEEKVINSKEFYDMVYNYKLLQEKQEKQLAYFKSEIANIKQNERIQNEFYKVIVKSLITHSNPIEEYFKSTHNLMYGILRTFEPPKIKYDPSYKTNISSDYSNQILNN